MRMSKRHIMGTGDKLGHHFFCARLVKFDDELVAFDLHDLAISEFLVKHAISLRKAADGREIYRAAACLSWRTGGASG